MITGDDVLASVVRHPMRPMDFPPTAQQLANATTLAQRCNALMSQFGMSRKISSGYRPAKINARTPGAAPKSNHIICAAVDFADPNGRLGNFCLAKLDFLEKIGLWLEHPVDTFEQKPDGTISRWCHVQIYPPASGRRVFRVGPK